jgi:hypothetical protein
MLGGRGNEVTGLLHMLTLLCPGRKRRLSDQPLPAEEEEEGQAVDARAGKRAKHSSEKKKAATAATIDF